MRDYGKVSPLFWTGNTGRRLRKRGPQIQLAALYLMTAPGATMLGVFHMPAEYLAHATGSPLEGALEALRSLSEEGFCVYDEESEWVWVCEMARYQIADALDPKDNRVKSVAKDWLGLPQLPFLKRFFERYGKAFHLPARGESVSPSEAPSKPLRSQEQEQEQEQETKAGADAPVGKRPKRRAKFDAEAAETPDWLPDDLWKRWCCARREAGKPITETACRQQLADLEKWQQEGLDAASALEQAIRGNWQGLYPPKARSKPSEAPTTETWQ